MGAVRMCVCQSERVRHAHKDVVQYCYDVMQWRWFNVCIRWKVFIVCTDSIICYRFQQEKDGERKAKRTLRFYEHVFVFTYNLSWIIRVKVEVLMEVTIHIYCLFFFVLFFWLTCFSQLKVEQLKLVSDSYQFLFLFMVYYLFRTVTGSISSLYIFVFFFFHLERAHGSRPEML